MAQDRFAPGEAYAFSLYPLKKAKKEAAPSNNKNPAPALNGNYFP